MHITPGKKKLLSDNATWGYRIAQTIVASWRHMVITPAGARWMMPVEEARLFGFPDGYTAITYRGKPASPVARHTVLGNS